MKQLTILSAALAVASAAELCLGQQQAALPEAYLKEQQYFIGTWSGKGKVGQVTVQAECSAQWAPGGHCLAFNGFTWVQGQRQNVLHWTFVSGWDPLKKQIVSCGFFSNGGSFTASWTIKSDTQHEGEETGITGTKEFRAKSTMMKNGPAEWTYSTTTADGEPIEICYRKVKKSGE